MRKAPIALLKNPYPLSLWERASVRVLACVKRIVFFLDLRRGLTSRKVSKDVYVAGFAPHPNPLPKGEGGFQQVLLIIASACLMFTVSPLRAQTSQPQPSTDAIPQQQQQVNNVEQMLGPLNLTSEQAQQIRRIYADLREERQEAGFRLRTAQRALTEAIQAPTPDEALIEKRSKEVADAQANTIRLRSLTEARILQVLTQDQRIKLRQLRAQAQMQRRNQQNQGNPGRGGNALQQNRNVLTPRQRRLMRQQQRPQ